MINILKKNIKFLIFLIISLLIFLALKKINLLNFEAIANSIKFNPELIILSAILYCISIILGGLRYSVILKNFKYNINLSNSVKITSSSIFFGQWFPGSAALIEFFRIFFLKQYLKIKVRDCVISVLYDRIIGLLSFIVISIICILINFNNHELSKYSFLIVIIGIILLYKVPTIIFRFFKINFNQQSILFISYEMMISLIISSLIILSYYLISKVTSTSLDLIQIALLMPLIAMVGILPIGLGNLGGLQLGTLIIFQFVTENNMEIVSMSLIFALITLIINTIFGIIFFKSSYSNFKKAILKYEEKKV